MACGAHEVHRGGELLATEEDVGAAGVCKAARISVTRADDQVSEAVTVEVSRSGYADPRHISSVLTLDDEATDSQSDGGKIHRCSVGAAEDDIAATGAVASRRISESRSDDQVGQSVTVDVTRHRDGKPALIFRSLSVDDKSTRSASHYGKIDGGCLRATEHDVRTPGFRPTVRIR